MDTSPSCKLFINQNQGLSQEKYNLRTFIIQQYKKLVIPVFASDLLFRFISPLKTYHSWQDINDEKHSWLFIEYEGTELFSKRHAYLSDSLKLTKKKVFFEITPLLVNKGALLGYVLFHWGEINREN